MKDSKSEVLSFWFVETAPVQWFQKNVVFDDMVRERFGGLHAMAREGFCDAWMKDAEGCLALCIILDQFPRNMFRGRPESFATDARALDVARHAVSRGFDLVTVPAKRTFLYLPFEHSENLDDQKKCVALFESMREDAPLSHEYALRHLKVIEKYGRFPHRNAILGRASTPAEEEYLAQAGTGF